MDKRTIFVLLVSLVATSALAEAYRYVDENGVVHYTDRPIPGAEEIILPDSNTTTVRRYNRPDSNTSQPADDAAGPEEPFRYDSIEVSAPAAEETLWNIGGVLNVSLALSPALQPGHQVRVYFDGEPQLVTGTSFTLGEVHRGVHNIQAEVLDQTGQLMIRSRTNRFYVQQATVLN